VTAFRIARVTDANNPKVGDLYVDAAGNFELVDGLEAIAQRIWVRLNFFLGEWPHDLRQGMPYREQFFEKGASLDTMRAILRGVIQDTPGVREVVSLDMELDRPTRLLAATFVARTGDGGIVSSDEYGPVIVALEERTVAA
jgi:hypothetical protein